MSAIPPLLRALQTWIARWSAASQPISICQRSGSPKEGMPFGHQAAPNLRCEGIVVVLLAGTGTLNGRALRDDNWRERHQARQQASAAADAARDQPSPRPILRSTAADRPDRS